MAQATASAILGPKKLKKSRFSARAPFESLSRPHLVIWQGRFHKTTSDLQHSCIGCFMQHIFNSFWGLRYGR